MKKKTKKNLYELRNYINDAGIFFCYLGPISQEIIEDMGQTIKNRIEQESKNFTIALRIFAIFIEQAQNIEKYSMEIISSLKINEDQLAESIITLGKKDNKYFIEFGNFINNREKNELMNRLEKISKMNKNTLSRYYKTRMEESLGLEQNNAGAGFIEIAKNASEPLEFKIHPVDSNYSFFSLTALV